MAELDKARQAGATLLDSGEFPILSELLEVAERAALLHPRCEDFVFRGARFTWSVTTAGQIFVHDPSGSAIVGSGPGAV